MADTWKTDDVDVTTNPSKKSGFGFSDPAGEYPLASFHNKPSLNPQVTGEEAPYAIDIHGGDPTIDLKDVYKKPTGGSTYGDVSVRQTKSGHVMVFDDTGGNESVVIKHADGSGFQLQADGTMVMSSKNNRVTQIGGTDVMMIEGDLRISAKNLEIDATGDLDLRVAGDYNLTVAGEKKETITGSSSEKITGGKQSTVLGSRSETTVENKTSFTFGKEENVVKGDVNYSISGSFDLGATGYSKITSEQQIAYSAPQIDIVGVKGQVSLLQGVFGGQSSFFHGLNYYGRSAKFSHGVTAPTFHGDLNGTAKQAIDANKAATAAEGSASAGGYSMTNTATNLIRDGKGPDTDSVKAMLTGDPRGIKKVSIDADGEIKRKLTRVKHTTASARALLKDALKSADAELLKKLVEEGVISDEYFNKVPPAVGRVTSGGTSRLPYSVDGYGGNVDRVSGEKQTRKFIPDSKYDPNGIDPRKGPFSINLKTLVAQGIPISTFLYGVGGGATTLNHIDTFEERQQLARQLMLQAEVLKLARADEGRFVNHKLVVTEGVYKPLVVGDVYAAKEKSESVSADSIPDKRSKGLVIVYELYDEQNRNQADVSYEFAAHLTDQLPFFEKITLDYDTMEPNPSNEEPHINTQIIVEMPEVDKMYQVTGPAKLNLETTYNNEVLSNSDLAEVTLVNGEPTIKQTPPYKQGGTFTADDFAPSKYATNIANKINECHPGLRGAFAEGVKQYLKDNFNDNRDMNISEAFRSKARSNALKAKGIRAASGGNSWHNWASAIDVTIYVNGKYDAGNKGVQEYTGRMRRAFNQHGFNNSLDGDSGHFWPKGFPAGVPSALKRSEISLDDYVAQNF